MADAHVAADGVNTFLGVSGAVVIGVIFAFVEIYSRQHQHVKTQPQATSK